MANRIYREKEKQNFIDRKRLEIELPCPETMWLCDMFGHKHFYHEQLYRHHNEISHELNAPQFRIYRCPLLYRLEQEFHLSNLRIHWHKDLVGEWYSILSYELGLQIKLPIPNPIDPDFSTATFGIWL